jgi:hypothetical protein
MVARFEAMVQEENAYTVSMRSDEGRDSSRLLWRTREAGSRVEYQAEPARSAWQKIQLKFLSLFPLDPEL